MFDNWKHYFVGADELEKLLSKGEGWLSNHPERDAITRRYLRFQPSLYRLARGQAAQAGALDGDRRDQRAVRSAEAAHRAGAAYHCLPVALVLQLPEKVCQERNRGRDDRSFGPHVVRQQAAQLRRSLRGLRREGFSHVFVLQTPEEVEANRSTQGFETMSGTSRTGEEMAIQAGKKSPAADSAPVSPNHRSVLERRDIRMGRQEQPDTAARGGTASSRDG